MYSFMLTFCLVISLCLLCNTNCYRIHDLPERDSIKQTTTNPRYVSSFNSKIPLADDCALRAFAIEMAGYIAPAAWKANWTSLTQSAFQMEQCNTVYQPIDTSSTKSKLFKTAENVKNDPCAQTVYVHGATGDDLFEGTFQRPTKTIQGGLALIRKLRRERQDQQTLCMTIRGGTYYLGTNATSSSSQIGAIALTSNDSNLVIENYQNELVILSGGALVESAWYVHKKMSNGVTILKSQIPLNIDMDQFNELYIDGKRAIVAKYPNGDPSTQGLYANDSGFASDSVKWWPSSFKQSVDVIIGNPIRNGTVFEYYQIGVGGGASVFNPPRNFWSTTSPPAGANYAVPSGVTVKNGSLPHIASWSNPQTGFVHAFHAGYWGSWVFEIASANSTEDTIMFGRGGFQEARGSSRGGAYYIQNIFEELDDPNEWFLDKKTRTLYFMPNQTMPKTFVASQIPCLISVTGSSKEDSVENVIIRGLVFAETSNTYMRDYMVPSGGDWSVHRGGTIYLTNTRNVMITNNLFTQLGSNGIAVIDYNEGTSITLNEFVWLGDSGIILVGSTNGIDGFSVSTQPMNTLIQSNIIHETGIYIKQSSPILISVSRSTSVIGNLMFNMPRAAININDGYYGNHTLSYNVIFNTVRETSDHGPINSWDRQPFLTDAITPGLPSLWQHVSYIHHNTLFNNYRSVWPIDHDDGSCFYEDSYNFLVYGGKKNYLGHSKTDHHEIYVYADANGGDFGSSACLCDYAPSRGSSGWNEVWVENTCILYQNAAPYNIQNCDTSNLFVPELKNNAIYVSPTTTAVFACKVNGTTKDLTLEQWQSYGLDMGTTVQTAPDVKSIIDWGRKMLQNTEP